MAERMLNDGKDLVLSDLLAKDLFIWQSSGRNEEIFASYVALNYDSSADYWYILKGENGQVLGVWDDGDREHVTIEE
jgi:hypothetical protein